MRNLQKILALVLALIMSFSLVATAGAFSDDGDISDAYKDAVTVLNGLEVFKGYDNGATFQPKGNITRAEVAAIIYRIATGDVKDTQASIYSTYGQFTDVLDGSWYAGYVNYCANAGYIKGRGNKIFDPQQTVTGYEALAMILRAVGYDKNGEFTGSNWQIRTASIANERGISKNVTSAMLGQAATREVVAELLFRSIIIPKVNFNANTLSYTEKPLNADGKKDTLGYESLKLEEIEGVVTANEYADLEATEPLSANRTRLDVDGVDYTLEYKSDLDYLGESRIAYVQNLTGSKIVNNVLLLGDTGDNVVYDEGKKIDTKDAAAEKGIKLREDTTQYFVNYDPIDEYQADWRIEYVYTWTTNTYAAVERVRNNKGTLRNLDTNTTVNTDVDLNDLINLDRTQAYKFEYRKTIAVGEFLTPTDISLINTIFSTADYEGDYILGEVYVGTTSIKKTDDISDDISYREFVDTYLTLTDNKKVVEKNGRGNRLKLIDNNNDGVVEYVLQTKYTVTTVSKTDSDGKFVLENKNVPLDANDVVNEIDNDTKFVKEDGSADLALNDVVLYAVIDGNARTEKAEMVNAKIDKVNRTNGEVTTTDGTTYEDSSICAHAEHYNDNPKEMAGNTNYNLYLDKYGYLAAFNEAEESFALLVDGWYNRVKGGDEYAVKTWQDGKLQTVDVSANGDLFIGGANSLNNDWDQIRTLDNATGSLNNANRTDVRNDVHTSVAMLSSDGVLTPVDMAYHTLKQSYIIDMKDNRLPDRDGERGQIYTTRANAIDRTAYNVAGVGADADVDVRALSSTVYYFVYNALSGNRTITQVVREYVGYQNLPNSDYANYIEDVYAVGTTQTSSVNNPYYTAEVVVVELNNDYYNTLGGEQVFIPRFPIAGTNVTLEEVKLVRENGAFEEVTIDLSRSDLRYYDIANGTETNANRNALAAGLYRMWRVSDSDTYYVRYMSAAEIDAADRYYVGMVDYNTGTGAHNYTVVDLYGRDVNDAHARATGASASALNLDTTKYYTYKGDELTESDRNTVMIQTPTADIRRTDTCVDWRNETQTNGGYQRNEVLIAYDKADNGEERIAYAISFNEYDSWDSPNSHVHDAAQTVWDSCTPYHNFGGVTPDPTYSITVNYEVDGAAVAAAPDGVVVTGAVADLANGTHVLNLTVDADKFTVNADSELQVGDNNVVIDGSDVVITVKLTTVQAPLPADEVKCSFGFYTMPKVEINVKGTPTADGKIELTAQALLDAFKAEKGDEFAVVTLSVWSVNGVTGAGPWTVEPGTVVAVELDAENDATVQSTTRTARPAARAGNDGLTQSWIIMKVETGKTVDDIDFSKSIATGFYNENGDELTADQVKDLLKEGEDARRGDKIAIQAYVKMLPTGKWSCFWKPVYKTTSVEPTGTVSVSVGDPLTAGTSWSTDLDIQDGQSWVKSCTLPIVNGVVTVSVRQKVTETSSGAYGTDNDVVPVMLDTEAKTYFDLKNGVYVAEIPAKDGEVITIGNTLVTDNSGTLQKATVTDVTMTAGDGVTILGANSAGQKAVRICKTNGKFNSAVFIVRVAAGSYPSVSDFTGDAANEVSAKCEPYGDDLWKITVTSIDSSSGINAIATINKVISGAPTVDVTTNDKNVRVPSLTNNTAVAGSFSFSVYVAKGFEPTFDGLNGAKATSKPTSTTDGNMVLWNVQLTNVKVNANVEVKTIASQTVEITVSDKGRSPANVQGAFKLLETDGVTGHNVRVVKGEASFVIYLRPGMRMGPASKMTATTGAITKTTITPYEGLKEAGTNDIWNAWKVSLSGIPASVTKLDIGIYSSGGKDIHLIAGAQSGITFPKNQENAYLYLTDGNKNAITFKVIAKEGTIPMPRWENVLALYERKAPNPKYEVTPTGTPNEWNITIGSLKKGSATGNYEKADLTIDAVMMPQVTGVITGGGVEPVGPRTVVAGVDGDGNFTAALNFHKTDSKATLVRNGAITVVNGYSSWGPNKTGGSKTGTLESYIGGNLVPTADGYSLTIQFKRAVDSSGFYHKDLTGSSKLTWLPPVGGVDPAPEILIPLKASVGYSITLEQDSDKFKEQTLTYTKPVVNGKAEFVIDLKDGYTIDDGEGYTVNKREGYGILVTATGSDTSDTTIKLNIRDISDVKRVNYEAVAENPDYLWRDDLFQTYLLTGTDGMSESGTMMYGEKTWVATTLPGRELQVKVTAQNDPNNDITAECAEVTYNGAVGINKANKPDDLGVAVGVQAMNKWTVRIHSDIPVKIEFIQKAIATNSYKIGGNAGTVNKMMADIYGREYETIWYEGIQEGVNTSYVSEEVHGEYILKSGTRPSPTSSDGTGKLFTFVAFVADGYEVVGWDVDSSVASVTIDQNFHAEWTGEMAPGYQAVSVTVELTDEAVYELQDDLNLNLVITRK